VANYFPAFRRKIGSERLLLPVFTNVPVTKVMKAAWSRVTQASRPAFAFH
jgi:hypothetical protein